MRWASGLSIYVEFLYSGPNVQRSPQGACTLRLFSRSPSGLQARHLTCLVGRHGFRSIISCSMISNGRGASSLPPKRIASDSLLWVSCRKCSERSVHRTSGLRYWHANLRSSAKGRGYLFVSWSLVSKAFELRLL